MKAKRIRQIDSSPCDEAIALLTLWRRGLINTSAGEFRRMFHARLGECSEHVENEYRGGHIDRDGLALLLRADRLNQSVRSILIDIMLGKANQKRGRKKVHYATEIEGAVLAREVDDLKSAGESYHDAREAVAARHEICRRTLDDCIADFNRWIAEYPRRGCK